MAVPTPRVDSGPRLRRALLRPAGTVLLVAMTVASLAACGSDIDASPATTAGPLANAPTAAAASAAPPATTARPTTAPTGASATSASQAVLADPVEVAKAAAIIAAADPGRPETLDAVDAVRFTDAGVEAAADALGQGATGDAQWAATWIYASGGVDPAPLQPMLAAEDPSVRAIAASGLLARGVRGAAEALAELASSDAPLRGSEPPMAVGDFAAATLARFVAGPSVAGGASRTDAAAAWSAWLAQHGSALAYDAEAVRWSAP